MSEAKFTKGPWTPCMYNNDDIQVTFFGVVISGVYHQIGSGNENRMNANLIASAPEMYRKLEHVAEFFDSLCEDDAANEIKALLAKARGELNE